MECEIKAISIHVDASHKQVCRDIEKCSVFLDDILQTEIQRTTDLFKLIRHLEERAAECEQSLSESNRQLKLQVDELQKQLRDKDISLTQAKQSNAMLRNELKYLEIQLRNIKLGISSNASSHSGIQEVTEKLPGEESQSNMVSEPTQQLKQQAKGSQRVVQEVTEMRQEVESQSDITNPRTFGIDVKEEEGLQQNVFIDIKVEDYLAPEDKAATDGLHFTQSDKSDTPTEETTFSSEDIKAEPVEAAVTHVTPCNDGADEATNLEIPLAVKTAQPPAKRARTEETDAKVDPLQSRADMAICLESHLADRTVQPPAKKARAEERDAESDCLRARTEETDAKVDPLQSRADMAICLESHLADRTVQPPAKKARAEERDAESDCLKTDIDNLKQDIQRFQSHAVILSSGEAGTVTHLGNCPPDTTAKPAANEARAYEMDNEKDGHQSPAIPLSNGKKADEVTDSESHQPDRTEQPENGARACQMDNENDRLQSPAILLSSYEADEVTGSESCLPDPTAQPAANEARADETDDENDRLPSPAGIPSSDEADEVPGLENNLPDQTEQPSAKTAQTDETDTGNNCMKTDIDHLKQELQRFQSRARGHFDILQEMTAGFVQLKTALCEQRTRLTPERPKKRDHSALNPSYIGEGPIQHTDVALLDVSPEKLDLLYRQSFGQVGRYGSLVFRSIISDEHYKVWKKTTNWDGSRGKNALPQNVKDFVFSALERKFPKLKSKDRKACIDRINEFLRTPRSRGVKGEQRVILSSEGSDEVTGLESPLDDRTTQPPAKTAEADEVGAENDRLKADIDNLKRELRRLQSRDCGHLDILTAMRNGFVELQTALHEQRSQSTTERPKLRSQYALNSTCTSTPDQDSASMRKGPRRHADVALCEVSSKDLEDLHAQSLGQVGRFGCLVFRSIISDECYRAWNKNTNWDGSRGKTALPKNVKDFVMSTVKTTFPQLKKRDMKDCIDRVNEYLRTPRRRIAEWEVEASSPTTSTAMPS